MCAILVAETKLVWNVCLPSVMSEKSVKFKEDAFAVLQEHDDAEVEGRLKKGKHSLDSDEEDDDGDKYDVMKEDDIEGNPYIYIYISVCLFVGCLTSQQQAVHICRIYVTPEAYMYSCPSLTCVILDEYVIRCPICS